MKALLGTKIGMTQVVGENGIITPVTLIQAGPITVIQIKTADKDGYNALQVGFKTAKKLSKPLSGHAKSSQTSPRFMREIRLSELPDGVKVGDTIDAQVFELGEVVNVTGTSKGKGFAGTVKRHNFNTSKRTHGGNGNVRKPGSIGSMYPQKVFKGKRMAGRMGHDQVTVKNLTISYISADDHLIGVKGAIPGPRKGLVMIGGAK